MKKIIALILLFSTVMLNGLETLGEIKCLDEKQIPANPDYLSIAVDYDGRLFLSNTQISLELNPSEKQFLLELLKQTQTYFKTVETDTITLPVGFLIGKLTAGTNRISVYFTTDGVPNHSKVYFKITVYDDITKPSLFSFYRLSFNKEHCLNLIDILERTEPVIQDLLRQKALFTPEVTGLK